MKSAVQPVVETKEIEEIIEKAMAKERLNIEEGAKLFRAKDKNFYRVIEAADLLRQEKAGDDVTYVVNRNINLTNVCVNSCKFCGYSRSSKDKDAYLLSIDEIKRLVIKSLSKGITEVCLVSGLHPNFDLEYYIKVIEEIKRTAPGLHIHGITPEELKHGLRNSRLTFREGYKMLKDAGLDSIPGTAAEILDDNIRDKICPDKISAREWIEAIKAAGCVGLKASATIMYGHIETIEERIKHLKIIRDIQDENKTFTEFIPLSFVFKNTKLYKEGLVTSPSSGREDMLMVAIARLFLDNINNIQTSWVKYGTKFAQLTLMAGANDLGGTLYSESITREAGGTSGEFLTPVHIEGIIKDLGRTPRERKTIY
ncbi:7,8-didemethyl-8-hydroxy-5-deazariboflavin synthase subunit CofH [Natranaerofaba carboxydovora]|uniref:7,8-didemethyl-8-hydroxy-5-deazariboflavin synthase subunit CofH n=1 Tax=Natranaerofaba carboxydovora TaxID=2742683 RepID=UPI001F1493A5|nr:7,8-didemethyl-8-hydroxy-5-deazariboflavin synthase subunit CofH [Natranaerofaba carboxydovora]UMZ73682.1 FO synthase [Natranaerofaba carboxydovora]